MGKFHGDTVVGGFLAADVRGTGLRGEIAWTSSDDPLDAERGRRRFFRATAGIDRQLGPSVTLTAEAAWNGFGVDDPSNYAPVAASDRFQRGEINALGRAYTGLGVNWEAHPLLKLSVPTLVNWGDGSILFQPFVEWSATEDATVTLGSVVGFGSDLDAQGGPGSEYGAVPTLVYGSVKLYF